MPIQVTIMSIDFDSFEEPVTKVFNKDEITVGRKQGNDLILDRPEVSSYHAKLVAKTNGDGKQKLYVTDLGSSNGTLLERDPLRPDAEASVMPNQRLIIGSYLLKPSIVETSADEVVESLHVPTFEELRAAESGSEAVGGEYGTISAAESNKFESASLLRQAHRENAQTGNGLSPKTGAAESEAVATHFSGSVPPVITLQVEGDSLSNIDFEATQLFSIAGRVTHKGQGLAGVKVDAESLGKFETDSDGRFVIQNVADGTDYRISLSKERFVLEPAVLSGSLSANADLHVAATQLFQLAGRVMHRGAPLSDVRIDAGSIGRVTTGPDGRFFFRDVRDGTKYHLSVDRDRFLFDLQGADGTLERDVELMFAARRLVTVSGRVVHKGAPLSDVQIECINLGKTSTDAEGRYQFSDVPEGSEYVFTAEKPGYKFSQFRRA